MSNSPVSRAARVSICIVLLLSLAAVLPREAQAAESWAWPVEGEVLTAYRNGDDPYAAGQHRGIDIGAPVGADVHAATAGTVTFAGTAGSSGLTVSVRTADGRFDTAYLHLDSIDVKAGDAIEAGDVLGSVGTSGRRSVEAPHVHFGVRDAGERHAYHDPLLFLSTPGAPVEPPPAPLVPPSRPAPRPVVAPDRAALAAARSGTPRVTGSRPGPVSEGSPVPVPCPGWESRGRAASAPGRCGASGRATQLVARARSIPVGRSKPGARRRGPPGAGARTRAGPSPAGGRGASAAGCQAGWVSGPWRWLRPGVGAGVRGLVVAAASS